MFSEMKAHAKMIEDQKPKEVPQSVQYAKMMREIVCSETSGMINMNDLSLNQCYFEVPAGDYFSVDEKFRILQEINNGRDRDLSRIQFQEHHEHQPSLSFSIDDHLKFVKSDIEKVGFLNFLGDYAKELEALEDKTQNEEMVEENEQETYVESSKKPEKKKRGKSKKNFEDY